MFARNRGGERERKDSDPSNFVAYSTGSRGSKF